MKLTTKQLRQIIKEELQSLLNESEEMEESDEDFIEKAKAVADYLVIKGISRSRIDLVSYGEERPVSLDSNESAYKLNRRVELK